jgi:[ribosomal protein S18]-alanine N-acetyltransferase
MHSSHDTAGKAESASAARSANAGDERPLADYPDGSVPLPRVEVNVHSAITTQRQTPICRAATLSDLGGISAVDSAVFPDMPYPYFVLRQLFDVHGGNCLVVEADRAVHGYALVAIEAERIGAWVLGLGVLPGSRRRGYGKALMNRSIELCRAAGVKQVMITVRPTNEDAYNLYRQSGFRWTHRDGHYFGDGEVRDVLIKDLMH